MLTIIEKAEGPMDFKDYYQILGIKKDATQDQIKRAFRRLAVKYHPYKNPGNKAAEAKFKEITEANEVLSDPEKRKQYDQLGSAWNSFQKENTRSSYEEWFSQTAKTSGDEVFAWSTDAEDIFVASSRYGYLKNRSISLKELAGLPLLLLQKDSATRRNLDAFFVSNSISIIPEIELESIELLVEFARIGLGIAHVLKESAAAHIKSGELFQVDITEKMPRRPMGIAMLKNMPQSQATNRFLHLLSLPSKDIQ